MFSDLVANLKEGAPLGTGALQSNCDRLFSLGRLKSLYVPGFLLGELLGLMPE